MHVGRASRVRIVPAGRRGDDRRDGTVSDLKRRRWYAGGVERVNRDLGR